MAVVALPTHLVLGEVGSWWSGEQPLPCPQPHSSPWQRTGQTLVSNMKHILFALVSAELCFSPCSAPRAGSAQHP